METKISDISIYNTRMDASIVDKLWFVNRCEADIYVDFGCANGNLLKQLSNIYGKNNKIYIGYDNNDDMLKIARENCKNTRIRFTNSFSYIKKYIDIYYKGKTVCLILSSVLHEVYSYSDLNGLKEFYSSIDELKPTYIVIRDMTSGYPTDYWTFEKSRLSESYIKAIYKNANWKQLSDFEERWGELLSIRNITHFLLKYKYIENWNRELNENYLPVTSVEWLELRFNNRYKTLHKHKYCLPYLKEQFKKDFDIDFKGFTHYNLLFELK